jgi:hypothetical protein
MVINAASVPWVFVAPADVIEPNSARFCRLFGRSPHHCRHSGKICRQRRYTKPQAAFNFGLPTDPSRD